MRIIAGQWRGRRIAAPDGRETRPTSDRVREAVFDMLAARLGPDLGGPVVADLFAGSGALGLEALSRGARQAVFVDRDRRALEVIRANVRTLGMQPVARVVAVDLLRGRAPGSLPGGPFSLLFADPPYRIEAAQVGEVFAAIAAAGGLAAGALAVYEHDAKAHAAWPAPFQETDRRTWGTTTVSFAIAAEGESAQ